MPARISEYFFPYSGLDTEVDWQVTADQLLAVTVQQKKDSVHSPAALTAVSGRTGCSITGRDVKDKVPVVQSCSAEVQSNPEAEKMGLPSRGAAGVLEP